METCPVIPLRNITLPENVNTASNLPKESEVEPKAELEVVKEQLNHKFELKKPSLDPKSVKIKKIKTKRSRGEKRKLSETKESCKKIKIKKHEEKSVVMDSTANEDVEVLSAATSDSRKEETVVSNPEGENIEVKQKSKQMSARKSKALENACKETLEILLTLDSEVLASMDRTFQILKGLNILNNKHVPIHTLIDLISLALDTNQAVDVVDIVKEMNFSKIVSQLKLEMSSSPKSLKARRSIALAESPKNIDMSQIDSMVPVVVLEKLEVKDYVEGQEEEEKIEEREPSVEPLEKTQEQTVEKSGKNFCITNYFKKLKKTVEERDKNERFSCFTAKADMFLAPKLGGELTGDRRDKFEEEFSSQTCEVQNLFRDYPKFLSSDRSKCKKLPSEPTTSDEGVGEPEVAGEQKDLPTAEPVQGDLKNPPNSSDTTQRKKITPLRVDPPKILPTVTVSRTKAKLLQFHDNRRPPYWGTWRRKSEAVGPRKPFAQDKLLNYEVDSDDEWEEEEEPGESLHGSDDEKEPEEDYEVDNDFFVPHGYLSDDENPEKENMSPKAKLDLLEKQFTSEQKQKTSKMMTPFVFGTYWVHNGPPPEGSIYQDLQIQNFQMVPWVATPIQIEEDDKKTESVPDGESSSQVKKQRQKTTFPDEEIPHLIKMIHGSPQNSEILARKFLVYWEGEKYQEGRRPGLTKICVLKKIKELATWQTSLDKGKRWHVPKETRKEFGADTEVESPSKKPRKCFIWKFVKKGEKGPEGTPSPSNKLEPEVVIL